MKCEACPAVGACVVEWTQHKPYCDWALRGGKLADRVRELSGKQPSIPYTPDTTIPLAESLELTRAMNLCPFRKKGESCCDGFRCSAGMGRKGVVNHQDCFDCLRMYKASSSWS